MTKKLRIGEETCPRRYSHVKYRPGKYPVLVENEGSGKRAEEPIRGYSMALVFSTTAVVDGICMQYAFFDSRAAEIANGVWNFVSLFVLILAIFIFCYWRILVVIRRQASVMSSYGSSAPSTSQIQSNQIGLNEPLVYTVAKHGKIGSVTLIRRSSCPKIVPFHNRLNIICVLSACGCRNVNVPITLC